MIIINYKVKYNEIRSHTLRPDGGHNDLRNSQVSKNYPSPPSIYGYSSRRISDTKTKTIEERLNKFFPILLEIAEEERKNRIKREEAQRKAEIARKIREQQEREYQAEMKRREELEQLSERFTKSEYIYQFIREVESKIKLETLDQEQKERFSEWKNWATEHADRLNPIDQVTNVILKPKPH